MVNMKRIIALVFLSLVFSAQHVQATDVRLGEEWAYRIKGSKVRLYGGDIVNMSSFASGDLELQLWAFSRAYRGRSQRGYRLAKAEFNPLGGGYGYLNVDRRVSYKRPKRGRWYVDLILCEWDEGGCFPRSWLNTGRRKFS